MAFGARKDDDGTWRICLRKGDTIRRIKFANREMPVGPFKSQAKAKGCADQLNLRWKEIEKARKPDADVPEYLIDFVCDAVEAHS